MLDTWKIFSSGFTIFGEVPLHRKLSVGGLGGLESISSLAGPLDVVYEIGGSLRFYVLGNVGEGLHLGLEGLRGFNGIGRGSDTLDIASFGLTIGYKHIIHCGRTIELVLSPRYQMIDDSMGRETTAGSGSPNSTSVGHSEGIRSTKRARLYEKVPYGRRCSYKVGRRLPREYDRFFSFLPSAGGRSNEAPAHGSAAPGTPPSTP